MDVNRYDIWLQTELHFVVFAFRVALQKCLLCLQLLLYPRLASLESHWSNDGRRKKGRFDSEVRSTPPAVRTNAKVLNKIQLTGPPL